MIPSFRLRSYPDYLWRLKDLKGTPFPVDPQELPAAIIKKNGNCKDEPLYDLREIPRFRLKYLMDEHYNAKYDR